MVFLARGRRLWIVTSTPRITKRITPGSCDPTTNDRYEVLHLHDTIQLRNRPPCPSNVRLPDGPRRQEARPYQHPEQRLRVLPQARRALSSRPDRLRRMHVRLVLAGRCLPGGGPGLRAGGWPP